MKEKHLVCQGAICRCIYGSNTDILRVNTQSKRYINDSEGKYKLIATNCELGATLEKNTFGSCARKNGNSCTVFITEWQDFYEEVKLEDNGGKILLEDSTASCPVGGSACIQIVFHGQQAELSKKNFQCADPLIHEALNPAGDIENIQQLTEDIYEAQ